MEKYITDIIGLQGKCSYNAENKARFRAAGMRFLRELRTALGVEADVRYNAGGIAVSGDCTLHSDALYISFNADGISSTLGVMYRSCRSRRDYSGGANCWFSWSKLQEYGVHGFAAILGECMTVPHDDSPSFEQHNANRQFFVRS